MSYAVAERISAERGESVGDTVGYKVYEFFLEFTDTLLYLIGLTIAFSKHPVCDLKFYDIKLLSFVYIPVQIVNCKLQI